jgi:integrase
MPRRRSHGEGTIRRRADGRWEVRITSPDGGRPSLYGRTRAEVQEKLDAARQAIRTGMPVSYDRQTVAEFLDYWLSECVGSQRRAKTYESYECMVRLFIKPQIGSTQLAKLQPQEVQSMLNGMAARGLAKSTMRNVKAVLSSALGKALKWQLVARNVAALVDVPNGPEREITPLDRAQALAFCAAVDMHRLEALFALAIKTGMREGELLGLRWCDIDFDRRKLSVRFALQRVKGPGEERSHLRLVEPKTPKSKRPSFLTPLCVAVLQRHRTRQEQERQLAGAQWIETGHVFVTSVGTWMDQSNLDREYKKLLAAASLPKIRFHDLRHTFATLLAPRVNARTLMEAMGHSQISQTMKYAHWMEETGRHAAETMEHILETGYDREGVNLGVKIEDSHTQNIN